MPALALPAPPPTGAVDRRGQKVLVVDDDPLYRTLCRAALAERYDVTTAADGHEAFGLALACPPDLIVLDALMPGWDGLRVLRAIRSEPTLRHIPVLLLTSETCEARHDDLWDAGADAIESKMAFTRDRLLESVTSLRHDCSRDDERAVRRVVPVM